MKILLWILGVSALAVLLVGALNRETDVPLDFLVGSTRVVPFFWLAVGAAAALLVAGLAGWAVGRVGAGDARGKLERELETTYRRLRESEARLSQPPSAPVDEAATAVAPAPAEGADAAEPTPQP